ncbi:MAG TPA: TraR/DksA family transcriptional regulator [Micromonosporaceae bacterium]|nr:TraR/DksA family transcriptional regulator [Micromonosporaceae bacterium]
MPSTVFPVPDRPHPALLSGLPVLRAMLEEQRQFRLDQLAELAAEGEVADRARSEVTATLVAGARQALHDIDTALDRMLSGHYGLCTRCHGLISVERLYVLPQTGFCVDCQRHLAGPR